MLFHRRKKRAYRPALDKYGPQAVSPVEMPQWTSEGLREAQEIQSYVSSHSVLYQAVAKWLLFDSRRWVERPTQLLYQISELDPWALDVSVINDPMVAVDICNSDLDGIQELQRAYNRSYHWNKYQKHVNLLQPGNDLYNQRILGILAYAMIAELLLVNLFGETPQNPLWELDKSERLSDVLTPKQAQYLPSILGYMPNKLYLSTITEPMMIDYQDLTLKDYNHGEPKSYETIPLRRAQASEQRGMFGQSTAMSEILAPGHTMAERADVYKPYGFNKVYQTPTPEPEPLNTGQKRHSNPTAEMAEILGGFAFGNWFSGGDGK